MTIYKYQISITGSQDILMPKGAQILSVQMQFGFPVLWAIVNADSEQEKRRISIVGTGHEFDSSGLSYLGTIQDGRMVWHVFEQLNFSAGKGGEG